MSVDRTPTSCSDCGVALGLNSAKVMRDLVAGVVVCLPCAGVVLGVPHEHTEPCTMMCEAQQQFYRGGHHVADAGSSGGP